MQLPDNSRRLFKNRSTTICLYDDGHRQVENKKLMMLEKEANFRSKVIEE